MLTVQRLQPVRDIEWLKRSNASIGCDGDSFVMTYLQEVLNFNLKNIVKVKDESDYEEHFRNKSIAAAFLNFHMRKFSSTSIARNSLPLHRPIDLEVLAL